MRRESIYWIIVFLTLLFILYKNRGNSVKILIILCFYSGLASFAGKGIENPYKIFMVLFSIYLLLKNNGLSGLGKKEQTLLIIFTLFSLSFFYSAIINGDYLNLVLSQYGKYTTPICLFFVLYRLLLTNTFAFYKIKDLIYALLTIQALLSIVKIFTYGLQESPVGSISYIGGGPAALLPVLGFIFVWIDKSGDVKRKDWYFIFLLIFIGFSSVKRAIWFIMPTVILLFIYYVPRKVQIGKLVYYAPLVLLIFYIGVRLNPTLNKETKIGGSFDMKYVMNYSQKYYFGKESENAEVQLGTGRGGSTLLLIKKLFSSQIISVNDLWGFGLMEVYTTDYDQFDNEKFGVNSKGAVSGIFQSYIASGFVGVFLTVLLILSVINLIKEQRIRYVIMLLMFYDYLFYSGLILRSQVLFILLFYIILNVNWRYITNSLQETINASK